MLRTPARESGVKRRRRKSFLSARSLMASISAGMPRRRRRFDLQRIAGYPHSLYHRHEGEQLHRHHFLYGLPEGWRGFYRG
ncbi:MAG: hypothetical protein IKO40_09385, partial [Kiritimatiellae bacterium]|nr:hypothetical protein [Kiritimatiellia bacterium]